jgi:hypothetical protein
MTALWLIGALCTGAVGASPACNGSLGHKAEFGHRTFLWSPEALLHARKDWRAGKKHPSFAALIRDADAALELRIAKVTDKRRMQKGASARHYASLAPYWWPDARNRSAPYVRRDGVVNPEREGINYDLLRLQQFSESVEALALAYYFSGEPRYADAAALWIHVWLLDPEHSMLPNLDYAQGVPGRASGRKEGVIDARWFMPVIESIGLLESAQVFSDSEHKQLRDWFAALVQWIAKSELGRAERAANNNHGIFYDLQLAHFALYAGYEDVAKHVLQEFPKRRLARQMAPDGSLPEELKRTRSFHYSTWTLGAIFDVATLSTCFDMESHWQLAPAQASPRKALAFIRPYLDPAQRWPWPERKRDNAELWHSLQRAAFYLRDQALLQEVLKRQADASQRYQLWLYQGAH